MPTLTNRSEFDLFVPQIHRNVGPQGSIEITADEARRFHDHGIFTVTETEQDEETDLNEESGGTSSATRRQITRGAARAEVNTAPAMETRG